MFPLISEKAAKLKEKHNGMLTHEVPHSLALRT